VRYAASALIAALTVAGCEEVPTAPSARDPDVVIASSTRFDFASFEGAWRMRAAIDVSSAPEWLVFGTLSTRGPTAVFSDAECPAVQVCADDALAMTATGPGRFTLADGREFWVLWVDTGFRTAAIGTPDGSYGWIIDRSNTGGADRITAAREVMAFNGYNISKLRVKP